MELPMTCMADLVPILRDAAALGLAAVVFGAHAVLPWRLRPSRTADQASPADLHRRAWSLSALPLALFVLVIFAGHLSHHVEAALAAGLGTPAVAAVSWKILAAAVLLLLISDLGLALSWRDIGVWGWRLAAILGTVAWAGLAWACELVRVGEGPFGGMTGLVVTACCRFAIGVALAELLAPGRPQLSILGAVALLLYFFNLEPELRMAILQHGDWLTLGAATAMLAVARWLPSRLRRAALAAAAVLVGLLWARVLFYSEALVEISLPPFPTLPTL